MVRLFYSAAVRIAAPIALALTALRGVRDPSYRHRLGERFGYTHAAFERPPIWVHAVSVGEVQAAAVLIRALRTRRPEDPLLITTATPTGAQRAAALFGAHARHAYLPYDTPAAVRRFLSRTRPKIAIVMEREIWPNLYRECKRRRIPVVLASARVSAASAERHRRLSRLFAPALAENVLVAAQTKADAERYRAIGADPAAVQVVGNVKFDLDPAEEVRKAGEALRAAQFPNRPVWVAGSTHAGEEEVLLDAHRRIRSVLPDALLILAPRHPDRFTQVAVQLTARGVCFVTRSSGAPVSTDAEVLLADTLGELVMLYAAGDVAFVGGSLVPIGGHNLLEPAALALPIVVGPHNFNAQDIASMMLQTGAAQEARSAQALAEAVVELFAKPERRQAMGAQGARVIEANRGAVGRLIALIEERIADGG
ncbi:MAG TPA: lipid IV(A) 3-deoxy-D-manno-octulosonic acid transferase [Steroidobacter sp.]|jgi:3-deoxy-D-manno-octulosonic-acid transferase|nr:lipid IV(A) 3-deoxy-D-manno-octulosonic acid transferase [Steroidobacter sp.]